MNRRTSPYTLQVAASPGADLPEALDALLDRLPDGTGWIDRHYATEDGEPYVSVTFRTANDETARRISEETLTAGEEARLLTGLGVHRRLVASWGQEAVR